MSDDSPADGFDYGERRDDGQFENHPTTDEGEFVRPVRDTYTHDGCGKSTRMGSALAESWARDPTQYDETFCCHCGDYYPVGEFVWKDAGARLDALEGDES